MANWRINLRRRGGFSFFIVLAALALAACGDKPVASTEDEPEAIRMFDVLHTSGLHVEKVPRAGEKAGWDIVIKEGWFGGGEAAVAMQVLSDYGLPRPKEILPETTSPYGMTSEDEIKKRQNREKEIQIVNHLYALPGVTTARVIVGLPENDILSLQKTPPTASVLLVQKEPQPRFTHADVQNLVSSAVPELKPENITVSISEQPLREVPLAQLAAQRRSNTIFAVGTGLIVLLAGALLLVWLTIRRRRKKLAEADHEQLAAGDEAALSAAVNQPALKAANDDVL